jgi:hypothetical protein
MLIKYLISLEYYALVTFAVHTCEQLYTAQRKETNTPRNIHQTHNVCARQFFSMALPAHSGPWPLIQSRNHFSQTTGLLGRVISPSQGRYLNTGQHKHRINAHTPNIHDLSGIRTHDPSVRASEDSSCLSAATVIGAQQK